MSLPELPPELPDEWQRAFRWIEGELGGRVTRGLRQARWRPAWFLDLERDGESLPLYFRGERGQADHGVYALEREARILQALEDSGIPVPHVYGMCPDPSGIVMERCPGRANLATADSEEQRRAVLDDYIDVLARMHAIDTGPFEQMGFELPKGPEQLALGDFRAWEKPYREAKSRPEPVIEFLIKWVYRNVPHEREQVAFICSDSGQFLYEGDRVTAVIDLELAHLGDPAADLAGLRSRDLSEPLGDLTRAVKRYEERAGKAVDRKVIDYHTVRFCLCTPLSTAHLVAQPPPGLDFAQYLGWYLVYARAPVEVIAHQMGLTLEPVELPAVEATRQSPAHDALVDMLSPPPEGEFEDEFTAYRRDAAYRVAEYLRRSERIGWALEEQDLDDVASLLGHRPETWQEADEALEALVEEAGPERDAELVRYFHRRLLRQEVLLDPVMRELRGAKVQLIG